MRVYSHSIFYVYNFRNFLRLGNPLNCKLDELQSPNYVPPLSSDKLTTISESEEVNANTNGSDEVDCPGLNNLRVLED